MARRSGGFAEFERRMTVVAERVEENSRKEMRRVALVVDQVLVSATPVDTGRARANWVVSVGRPDFSTPWAPRGGKGAGRAASNIALSQAREAVKTWNSDAGPIFISNGLPYIDRLDKGYSAQAPNGMTAQALEAGAQYARSSVRLLRDST